MTLEVRLGPQQFEFDGEVYNLLDLGAGRVQWDVKPVPGQIGDSTQSKSAPLEFHGGFGATHRIRRGNGSPSDPAHHAYGENMIGAFEGILYPAPRVTYVDGAAYAVRKGGFRVGGYSNSVVGGTSVSGGSTSVGAIGGGSYNDVPQHIRQFGDVLYVHCGAYTLTLDIDQATPVFVEGKFHGSSARARKSDVFRTGTNGLMVALGSGENAAIATSPYTSATATVWAAAQVARDVFTVGPGGRLFSSLANKVYNVLPSADASLSASYLPSNGETITDPENPVRELVEFSSSLVAGTATGARTLDPDRGYQGVPVTAESRVSASEYDGRAMLSIGPVLFYATSRGVQMIVPGQPPRAVGPELLHHNDTPYKGIEWGRPDYLGNWMAWPAYIADTGDSVIFLARLRDAEDVGTGPVVWHDAIFIDGRECRTARLWGGTSTRGPRLVFGAGTTANPYQVGWCDLGKDGGPDVFTSDGQPAMSAFIETPLDDLGAPGVVKSVERVEIPYVHNADSSNYFTVQARAGHDGALTNLVKAQTGSNQERINTEGFARVFAQTASQVASEEVAVRISAVQASGATVAEWLQAHGTITLYYSEAPDTVRLIATVLDAKTTDLDEAQAQAEALRALMAGGHKRLRYAPGGVDLWARVVDATVAMQEVGGGDGDKANNALGIKLTLREVLTS